MINYCLFPFISGRKYGKSETVFKVGDIFTSVISIPNKYIFRTEGGDYRGTGSDASFEKEDKIDADAVNDAVNDRLKTELL